jgi:hypothetical protein
MHVDRIPCSITGGEGIFFHKKLVNSQLMVRRPYQEPQ